MIVIKYIKNEKGNTSIWMVVIIFIFLGISILVMDNRSLYMNNKTVKESLSRAVKAATLAIREDEKLPEGNFTIDPEQAEIRFKQILAKNIGLNEITLEPLSTGSLVTEKPEILEFIVENSTPIKYYSPILKNSFTFEHPTVLAVIMVKVKGIFSSRMIRMYKMSGSQLTSIYD